MKRTFTLLLALLFGCTAASATTLSEPGVLPIVEGERETLSILIAEDTLVTSFEDNAFTRYVEENCNVDLEFTFLPASDAASKLQLMISSGETLPDVICFSRNLSEVYAYAQAGAIIPLDEYYEKYSVNLKAAIEQYPEIQLLEQITAADGHMYSIPRYFREIGNNYSVRYWINHQWLENLGLDVPTTTEEFYQVLKAFKERDPNGNGLADEIPLMGAWPSDTSTYNVVTFLMNSFVYTDPGAYLYLEDGQVQAAYATEGWKKGLEYMHRLVDEGLLDASSFTQTSSQLLATLSNPDICILGCYSVQGAKEGYIDQFDALMPLEGPDGLRQARYTPTRASQIWMITADCENPELAYRVGDFMFTEEAFLLCRVGEEGVSWTPAEEGDVSILGDEFPATFRWLDEAYNWWNANNAIWRQAAPLFAMVGLNGQVATENLSQLEQKSKASIMNYSKFKPADGTYITFLNYTEEEEFTINDISATLRTYAVESMIRFITGDMDLATEWDAYLRELDSIGLDTYLETTQRAYERSNGQ